MTHPPPGPPGPPGLPGPPPGPPGPGPRELRPRRAWYWVAAAVVVAGVCVGGGGFLLGLYSILNSFPSQMDAEFTGGSPAAVELSADREAAIYLANPDAPEQIEVTCEGAPLDGGEIELVPYPDTLTFQAGERRWQLIYRITVTESGEYELRCTSTESVAAHGRFGVTDDIDAGALAARTFGTLAVSAGAPCAGLFAGGLIALVTGLRRSAHRKRLLQQPAGRPPWPPSPSGQ